MTLEQLGYLLCGKGKTRTIGQHHEGTSKRMKMSMDVAVEDEARGTWLLL